jgi:transcriptional regulator with XRE-family HTH domain
MPKRANDPVDKYVGQRVRMRRMQLGMSQSTLAKGLNLTFQQVQKYEKGANRIGAGRLQTIAGLLKMPVFWFYQAAPGSIETNADDAANRAYLKFVTEQDGGKLMANWQVLTKTERLAVASFVKDLTNGRSQKERRT